MSRDVPPPGVCVYPGVTPVERQWRPGDGPLLPPAVQTAYRPALATAPRPPARPEDLDEGPAGWLVAVVAIVAALVLVGLSFGCGVLVGVTGVDE